jgi:hypothetical protein
MTNLAQALQRNLETIQSYQQSGQTGALASSGGAKAELMARLTSLLTTGGDAQEPRGENQTGLQHGGTGAVQITNVPPEVPAQLAGECLTKRLPPSVQSWLEDMEWVQQVGRSTGMKVHYPKLKPETRATICFELSILSLIMQPASVARGGELTKEVSSFLAMFPFGLRTDATQMALKVDGWCSELERYPLYAIKLALNYWKQRSEKEPSFAEVLADVKYFCGSKVWQRRQLLQNALVGHGRD